MFRSCIYVFLAIALFLAACLCVSAAENEKTDNDEKTQKHIEAEEAVAAVEELAQETVKNATKFLNKAKVTQSNVQSHKQVAQKAILQMKNVSNDNTKAASVAAKVKTTAEEIIGLYENATKAAEDAVKSMNDMVTKAKELVTQANITITADSELPNNYVDVKKKVAAVNASVGKFQTEMKQKVTILEPASDQEIKMSALVDKVNVGTYHFSVTLSVSKIDTVLREADDDIEKIQKRKEEVNKILNEMKEKSKSATESPPGYVEKMIDNAENALLTASQALADANKVKKEMLDIKEKADESLAKFEDAKKPEDVEDEVRQTKKYAQTVDQKAPEITNALKSADITATNAKANKNSFISVLSPGSTQPRIKDNKILNKPGETLMDKDKTTVDQEKEPLSTTITESITQDIVQTVSKSMTGASGEETKDSEETLDSETDALKNSLKVNPTMINSEKTTSETSENSVQQASEKVKIDPRDLQQVKNTNIIQVNLNKSTKNRTKIPLVDGNISALSTLGDGSMLVFVTMLGALIASAVLH